MEEVNGNIEALLAGFTPIGLSEVGDAFLMKRKEIKYFFHEESLPALMALLRNDFQILKIGTKTTQNYMSRYLDTTDRFLYLKHHNSHGNRYKFRFRHYVDSDTLFFEVKHRQNTGITVKHRVPLMADAGKGFNDSIDALIRDFSPYSREVLETELVVSYQRMGLIHKNRNARITIDRKIGCNSNDGSHQFGGLIILELKYNKSYNKYPLMKALRQLKLYPERISKYCMSTCKLYPEIKHNRFKRKLRRINQIETKTKL